VIETYDYETAFLWFGLIQGGIVVALALFLRGPKPAEMASAPAPKVLQSARNFTPKEVLLSQAFGSRVSVLAQFKLCNLIGRPTTSSPVTFWFFERIESSQGGKAW
jgi:hypothetical protein